MNIPHWLRFYRKPISYLTMIGVNLFFAGSIISIILTIGLDIVGGIFLGVVVSSATMWYHDLYKWRKQFLQWKTESGVIPEK